MGASVVRIEQISIFDYKNVRKGIIDLANSKKYKADLLGLYGQNGSGKTALIDAIDLLKTVLCGLSVPDKYADAINIESDFSTFCFKLSYKNDDGIYYIWYEFELHRAEEQDFSNMEKAVEGEKDHKVEILNESITYAGVLEDGTNIRKTVLINTKDEGSFGPQVRRHELIGRNKSLLFDVMVKKQLIRYTSRSFIFSKEMMDIFDKECTVQLYRQLFERLKVFGNKELFIIKTLSSGLISLNVLPIAIKYKEKGFEAIGTLGISLEKPSPIPQKAFELAEKVISNLNIVLTQIVPGLTISIRDLGPIVLDNGEPGKLVQLISLKNEKEIPFTLESEGIKKIVSVLQLLIVVYNNPSVTVAIDELDGGVFEYLLGELLRIIAENGKGQLIFTSHNLRPLETIDKEFIAFTTTDPSNRYCRLKNIKPNNNLRDLYYRNIMLGEQTENLYDQTDNYHIMLAFREAGEALGG